jgi:hypothetical protein
MGGNSGEVQIEEIKIKVTEIRGVPELLAHMGYNHEGTCVPSDELVTRWLGLSVPFCGKPFSSLH